jgi:copper chaperone CopZ
MHRRISSGLLFCAILGIFAAQTDAQQPKSPKNAIKVYVDDMHCESCAKKIRSRIFTVKGVSRVVTFVKHDLAVVQPVAGQSVSTKAIWDALEKAKFNIDRIETPQGVVSQKPKT